MMTNCGIIVFDGTTLEWLMIGLGGTIVAQWALAVWLFMMRT